MNEPPEGGTTNDFAGCLPDMKRFIRFFPSPIDFNPSHSRKGRSLLEPPDQELQFLLRTRCSDFDIARSKIPNPAAKPQASRLIFHEEPKTNSLNAARNQAMNGSHEPIVQRNPGFSRHRHRGIPLRVCS